MPIRSQEPLSGLQSGCRVQKLWAALYCFPGPQAGSWKGSGAAGIRTGAHMGSRACKARTFNHLRHRAGPRFFFLSFIYLLERWSYRERKRVRERSSILWCKPKPRTWNCAQASHVGNRGPKWLKLFSISFLGTTPGKGIGIEASGM